MKVLKRLKVELANKDYFREETDEIYSMYLNENNLNPNDEYIKKDMERNLLLTCVRVLEAITNDTDLMRTIDDSDIGFKTTSVVEGLRKKIRDLKIRINEIPLEEEDYSNVQLLFYTGRR